MESRTEMDIDHPSETSNNIQQDWIPPLSGPGSTSDSPAKPKQSAPSLTSPKPHLQPIAPKGPNSPLASPPIGSYKASIRSGIVPIWIPGQLVWAKMGRQPYWPGQVVDPQAKECTKMMIPTRPDYVLIHFFGSHDYLYVAPTCIALWQPNDVERSKKSRSQTFVKACQEINMFHATSTPPEGWDKDDVSSIQTSLQRLKQARPELAQNKMEEARLASQGLIVEHSKDFQPLKRPGNDNRSKKRREHRLKVMRYLGLYPPAIESQ